MNRKSKTIMENSWRTFKYRKNKRNKNPAF